MNRDCFADARPQIEVVMDDGHSPLLPIPFWRFSNPTEWHLAASFRHDLVVPWIAVMPVGYLPPAALLHDEATANNCALPLTTLIMIVSLFGIWAFQPPEAQR